MMKHAILAQLSLFLVGCAAVGPSYKSPDLALSPDFHGVGGQDPNVEPEGVEFARLDQDAQLFIGCAVPPHHLGSPHRSEPVGEVFGQPIEDAELRFRRVVPAQGENEGECRRVTLVVEDRRRHAVGESSGRFRDLVADFGEDFLVGILVHGLE